MCNFINKKMRNHVYYGNLRQKDSVNTCKYLIYVYEKWKNAGFAPELWHLCVLFLVGMSFDLQGK